MTELIEIEDDKDMRYIKGIRDDREKGEGFDQRFGLGSRE